jgi:ABC-type Na+ efflux pump permease subunit
MACPLTSDRLDRCLSLANTTVHLNGRYAFLKKLAILPWPLPPVFLPFAVLIGLGAGFAFLDSGSSSEKDSQTASSLVTANVRPTQKWRR